MYNKNMYYIFTVAKFYKLFLSVKFNSVLLMRKKMLYFNSGKKFQNLADINISCL